MKHDYYNSILSVYLMMWNIGKSCMSLFSVVSYLLLSHEARMPFFCEAFVFQSPNFWKLNQW